MLARRSASLLAAAGVLGTLGAGVAHAQTRRHPHATAAAGTPLTVSVTVARETSSRYRTIQISGRVGPTASLAGGAGSIILYRETRSGLAQLSFNGPQTHPAANGSFSIRSAGEPTGANTYVLQYVPSAPGFALQGIATERISVMG